jgi:hypothetical protein
MSQLASLAVTGCVIGLIHKVKGTKAIFPSYILTKENPPNLVRMRGQKWPGGNRKMVPLVGFELTTYRLQGGCSTN